MCNLPHHCIQKSLKQNRLKVLKQPNAVVKHKVRMQFGFSAGKSTANTIFNTKLISQTYITGKGFQLLILFETK